MNIQLLDDFNAALDLTTTWIPLSVGGNRFPDKFTIQSVWSGLTGTLDGSLTIQVTNDPEKTKPIILKEYSLDEAALTEVLAVYSPFAFMRLVYIGGNITGGLLSVYATLAYGDFNG